ncbi:MAG: septal ring lytic transglycosylase RlpA family protein [Silvibacterium sp.]
MNAIAIPKNTRSRRYALLAGTVLVTLLGITGTPAGNAEQPLKQAQPQPHHHWYQIGRASWYGKFFQGRETASGEDFDMNAMTCAHRSLPMGSLVKVTNLSNHRSVVLRVNDRGPVPQNRIIDLSYAAARFLGFGERGTAPVRIDLITDDSQLAQLTFPANGLR